MLLIWKVSEAVYAAMKVQAAVRGWLCRRTERSMADKMAFESARALKGMGSAFGRIFGIGKKPTQQRADQEGEAGANGGESAGHAWDAEEPSSPRTPMSSGKKELV